MVTDKVEPVSARLLTGRLIIAQDPPDPTLMEIYVYDPLDYIAIRFFHFSLILLAAAVISDIFSL